MTTVDIASPSTAGRDGDDEPSVAPGPAGGRRSRLAAGPILVLVAIAALGIWSRSLELTSSFWQDEAKPITDYVDRGPGEILFGAYDIDNHVFYNLLTWAVSRVLGTAEIVHRLVSLVPAVVSAGLLVAWVWRRIGAWASVLVAALVAFSPLHLDLAPQARAYGLTYLAFTGLLIAGDSFIRHGQWRDALLFGASGLVGAASFPIFGLPLAFAALVVLVAAAPGRRRSFVLSLVPFGAGLALLTFNAVPQLLTSAGDFQSHRRLAPLGIRELVLWPHRLVSTSFTWGSETVPPLRSAVWDHSAWEVVVSVALVYPLLGLGLLWLVRRRGDWPLAALLVVPVLGTYAVVVARGMALWPRYTSFFLYPIAVGVAAGAHAVGTWLWHRPEARAAALAACALLTHPLLTVLTSSTVAAVAAVALALAAVAVVFLDAVPSKALVPALAVGALVATVPMAENFTDGARTFDEPLREDWKSVAADAPDSPDLLVTTSIHAALVYYLGTPEYSLEVGTSRKRIERYEDEVQFVSDADFNERICAETGQITLIETAARSGRVDLSCLAGRQPRRSRYPMLLYGGHADLTVIPP